MCVARQSHELTEMVTDPVRTGLPHTQCMLLPQFAPCPAASFRHAVCHPVQALVSSPRVLLQPDKRLSCII